MQSADVLVKVSQLEVLKVDDVEHTMGSGAGAFIYGQQHVLMVYYDLVKERVIEAEISLFPAAVGILEEGENLGF